MAEQISLLLERWSGGDRSAMDKLLPEVYDELRKLGRSYLQRRAPHSLLQPTVLVHEAWLKISSKQELPIRSRAQFYAFSAKIMRDILVDFVRNRQARKRGGDQLRTDLNDEVLPGENLETIDLLALNDALERLGKINPRCVDLVELRFFSGLTIVESAEALQTSHATLEREWSFARAWLKRELMPSARSRQ